MRRLAAALLLACAPAGAAGFKTRGVLEGFYGRPWTWEQRASMADWIAAHGGNLLVIAPKDEPLQRRRWREPLPPEYLSALKKLVAHAAARHVSVAWSLSPLDARLNDRAEAALAARKLKQVHDLGVSELVLAFDDTAPDAWQVIFANRVFALLGGAPLTFVPAEYWGLAAPSPYLDRVARDLSPAIRVGWTGPKVLSETITAEDGRRFSAYIKHKLVLGDNYPVQDRLFDSGPLYLAPLLGREAGLVETQDAFLSNASPLAEASKLPLATALDWARDPSRYDPEKSWHRAIKELAGPDGAPWLELLARECSVSWVSDPPPEWLRRQTTAGLLEQLDKKEIGPWNLDSQLLELYDVARQLRSHSAGRRDLVTELQPWADKLSPLAEAAIAKISGKPIDPKSLSRIQDNPAAVSDFALDRVILTGTSRSLPEALSNFQKDPNQAKAWLRDLGALAALFPPSEEHGWPGGLLPWFSVLGMSANRALAYAEAGHPPFVPDKVWRWRLKMRMLPLLVCRLLLENRFREAEARWSGEKPEPAKLGWLGVWLWAERWIKPSAFTVQLSRRLQRYRETGDSAPLRELLIYLRDLPAKARAAAGAKLPPEMDPWLEKTADYGRVGLLSLDLDRAAGAAARLSPAQRERWETARRRLASANGLEQCLKLKLWLEAFTAWRRLPAERRPARLRAEWPANPADWF